MINVLLVAVGGGLGSAARYLVNAVAQRAAGNSYFPWGTLAVNVLGCFVFGLLSVVFLRYAHDLREELRLAVLVGFLGGFTTFSAFAFETLSLAGGKHFTLVAVNLLATNILCLAAGWIGYRLIA